MFMFAIIFSKKYKVSERESGREKESESMREKNENLVRKRAREREGEKQDGVMKAST